MSIGTDVNPENIDGGVLQNEVGKLRMTACNLDKGISEMQERPRELSDRESNEKRLHVTEEDIESLPCFQNETLIAINAPHGTTMEVPDLDEAADCPQRRYRFVLRSTMVPIDVYLVSKSKEAFEQMGSVEMCPNTPALSIPNCSDSNLLQEDNGGIMKIVLSDIDTNADYWLLSDPGVSISDMWKKVPDSEWDKEARLNAEDFVVSSPQTPALNMEALSNKSPLNKQNV